MATKVSNPFTISYELQLFTVCRAAHEPVILTGQGSDEYFGGCASFSIAEMFAQA
jgi:asparagine synthase (glutamine-hydrolysing)